ncbi:MAG: acyl-CoA thioesterase [Alicyclobacillaceae bacterium]|nr:acyl-CoA thioesterase [Alicyclobacillaceae bacterium]
MAIRSKVRVRFCETDALGHVNNISYFIYLEQGRTDFMREIRTVLGRDIGVILASAKCDFRAQSYFDEELTIRTEVRRIGTSSVTLAQTIYKGTDDRLVAEAESVLVHFDHQAQRPVPIPDDLREVLKRHMAEGAKSPS